MLQAVEVFFASLYAFIKLIVLDVAAAFQDGELFLWLFHFSEDLLLIILTSTDGLILWDFAKQSPFSEKRFFLHARTAEKVIPQLR
ncbi:hypothetical protein [Erwinia amylovora]|uniref:hypothetical protein n=1 Tax=Erwinia amylovora TaxID=552 RepID=UPI000C072A37|nr:hypothetical protein [Erwinia amylovora]